MEEELPPLEVVERGGVALAARLFEGVGGRVVALHGGPGADHRLLVPLARRIAPRFAVLLPDLPGHGASRPEAASSVTLQEVEQKLIRWAANFVTPSDVIVGHSLGAWLALRMLVRRRIEPAAAVLIAPPAVDAGMAFHLPPVRSVKAARNDLIAHVRRECRGDVPKELLEELEESVVHPLNEYRLLLRTLHEQLLQPLPETTPHCAILLLAGERDATTSIAGVRRLGENLRAEVVIVPDAGHYLHAERPDETAELIVSFIE